MSKLKMIEDAGELLYCIQCTDAPIFEGPEVTPNVFQCEKCTHVLVANYSECNLVNIGLKCFRCGFISRTPESPLGEVLDSTVISLGSTGGLRLEHTAVILPGRSFTCDHEIERKFIEVGPKNTSFPLKMTAESLNILSEKYNEISGGKLDRQKELVARKPHAASFEFPFVWALAYVEKCLVDNFNYEILETRVAVSWLAMFSIVIGNWGHHPRFLKIASGIAKREGFHHTIAQFVAARHLSNSGNYVGLNLELVKGEPNPDLYIDVLGIRQYIEVKAPRDLQLGVPGAALIENLRKTVADSVKRSSGQINKKYPGSLVIFSGFMHDNFFSDFENIIRDALSERGRNQTSLAAVIGLTLLPLRIFKDTDGSVGIEIEFKPVPIINDNFNGDVAIKIGGK